MEIRSSVQAVIVKREKILTVKKVTYDNKTMYILPGGGQEHGETLKEAVVRECKEETGLLVEAKELLYVSEYIGKNHEHAEWDSHIHVVVHLFLCSIIDESAFNKGIETDPEQVALEWLPLEKLSTYEFYPYKIIPHLTNGISNKKTQVYVGDMG
ncbi:NUDIX domain-containing protein [Paucisalibacillus globulus]|uniref:NUDIX domain-containing protein n=1 Tax=Paucisalibacillus globulus TaxID=351095 RepID=UPI000419B746|nr:NUDIX domain-containing protein [Paucisalibacillus globulus]